MKSFYLASPLGFAASTMPYMNTLAERLRKHIEVVNPWDDTSLDHQFARCSRQQQVSVRDSEMAKLNRQVGKRNQDAIDEADGMIAVLDGADVDSGTAAEIGYAFARDKLIFGLRTDFRLAGDNPGAIVNLQVEHFILESGGEIALGTDYLVKIVKEFAEMAEAIDQSRDS